MSFASQKSHSERAIMSKNSEGFHQQRFSRHNTHERESFEEEMTKLREEMV